MPLATEKHIHNILFVHTVLVDRKNLQIQRRTPIKIQMLTAILRKRGRPDRQEMHILIYHSFTALFVHYYCMCVYYLYSNDEPSGSLQDAHWAHEDKELRLVTVPNISWTLLECWQHQLDCSIHIHVITTFNPM